MIDKINDQSFVDSIFARQTVELIKRFKTDFPKETKDIELLERVNLMTPENIHFNSFMYEPILDMSDISLISLYKEIKDKNAEQNEALLNNTGKNSKVAVKVDNIQIIETQR